MSKQRQQKMKRKKLKKQRKRLLIREQNDKILAALRELIIVDKIDITSQTPKSVSKKKDGK